MNNIVHFPPDYFKGLFWHELIHIHTSQKRKAGHIGMKTRVFKNG